MSNLVNLYQKEKTKEPEKDIWYKIKVTKTVLGPLKMYIKGGAYTDWTLIPEKLVNNYIKYEKNKGYIFRGRETIHN